MSDSSEIVMELRGTWDDPAIVDDSRIDHGDPLVRRVAEHLHNNESMHMHWYVGAFVCPYCALRASRAVKLVRLAAPSTSTTPEEAR